MIAPPFDERFAVLCPYLSLIRNKIKLALYQKNLNFYLNSQIFAINLTNLTKI